MMRSIRLAASLVLLYTTNGQTTSSSSSDSTLNTVIAKAEASDNPKVQAVGALANLGVQSGIIPQSAGNTILASNPKLEAAVNGLKNGAAIAKDVDACYSSVQGQDVSIRSAYSAVAGDFTNSDTVNGATEMGSALFKAYLKTTSNDNSLYELFRIYLDQQANTGKVLSDAQKNAYEELTPECNNAFAEIVQAYSDTHDTVTSLMAGGNKNVTCSNYQNGNTSVDMTLCVWPSAIWANDNAIYANISATFTNYGVQLCDVSFYVINLDGSLEKEPAWLPDVSKGYPNGLPSGEEIAITATVPWDNTIAKNAPIVDILKGWYACPNGMATPAPTAARTPKATNGVLNSAQSCFLTTACQQAVAPYAADACGAYAQLLSSGCSTCSETILKSAQSSCLESCSSTYCRTVASDKGTATTSAAPSTFGRASSILMAIVLGAVAVFANL